MADGGLLLIFRGQTTEALLAMQEKLMEQFIALGPYASQSVGTKSFTKDSRALQAQMEAIQFVLNERGQGGYVKYFVYDFSQGEPAGQPAGETSELSY